MSYYYKAETNLAFIRYHLKIKSICPNHLLKVFLLSTVMDGSVKTAATTWAMGEGTGSMAWVNLTVIFLLTKTALKVLKDYEMQKKEGENPVFEPVKLGIKGADFWEKEYREISSRLKLKFFNLVMSITSLHDKMNGLILKYHLHKRSISRGNYLC
jgi:AGCS family alanine or glycine:cation symporter